MGWKEKAAVQKQYTALKHAEVLKRNGLLKQLEAERRAKLKELEANHKVEIHLIHEAFGQAMQELEEREADAIEGSQR